MPCGWQKEWAAQYPHRPSIAPRHQEWRLLKSRLPLKFRLMPQSLPSLLICSFDQLSMGNSRYWSLQKWPKKLTPYSRGSPPTTKRNLGLALTCLAATFLALSSIVARSRQSVICLNSASICFSSNNLCSSVVGIDINYSDTSDGGGSLVVS